LERNFKNYQGSIGLCWIDQHRNIFLYRHNQELSIGYSKDVIYFSSDKDHLKELSLENIQTIKEDKLYRIKKGKIIYAKNIPSPKPVTLQYGPGVTTRLGEFEHYNPNYYSRFGESVNEFLENVKQGE
ncbi:MAG: hypothetical protein AABY22_36735, partial [Nanoarchaeota archaeon]